MTELAKTTHPLRIFAGSANCPLADKVARRLGVELGKCVDFPCDSLWSCCSRP